MYIKYQDDPVRKRVNSAFGDLCAGQTKKNTLKLFDQCFSIFKKEEQVAAFCELANFQYPVDGFQLIDLEVCAASAGTVFNNNLQSISLTNGTYPLSQTKAYVRGVILAIKYPTTNSLGAEITTANMKAQVRIYDRPATAYATLGIGDVFVHFSNEETLDANDLLNRLDIYNPNANASIKVKALLINTKSIDDPNNVVC